MKSVLKTASLLGFAATIALSGCAMDDADSNNNGSGNATAAGTISFELDGQPHNFVVDAINIPLAYECTEGGSDTCNFSISGVDSANNLSVVLTVHAISEGDYTCADDKALGILIMDTSTNDILVSRVNGSGEACSLSISQLDGVVLTDQGQTARLGSLLATFDGTFRDYEVTNGTIDVSKQ